MNHVKSICIFKLKIIFKQADLVIFINRLKNYNFMKQNYLTLLPKASNK